MKLASALLERCVLINEVDNLKERIMRCLIIQEGMKPVENPSELLSLYSEKTEQLCVLTAKINKSNALLTVDGVTITSLLSTMDNLKKKISLLKNIIDEASAKHLRHLKSELKMIPCVDTSSIVKLIDTSSKRLREVNEKIQQANWTLDIID